MDPSQMMLGTYSLPFILSMILGFIYKKTNIADDAKPFVAAICGGILGLLAMVYNNSYSAIDFTMIADYFLAGSIGVGFGATGIHEATKASPLGTTYIAVDSNNKKIQGARVLKVNKPKIMRGDLK
jgi:hypothetical protein